MGPALDPRGDDDAVPDVSGSSPAWPDDPVDVLARVYALRQMADLGGFRHLAEWDVKEAWATERLSQRSGESAGPVDGVDLRDEPTVADPFLAFAQVSAARLVADEQGMTHSSAWDETERVVGEQLRREARNGHPEGARLDE